MKAKLVSREDGRPAGLTCSVSVGRGYMEAMLAGRGLSADEVQRAADFALWTMEEDAGVETAAIDDAFRRLVDWNLQAALENLGLAPDSGISWREALEGRETQDGTR